MANYQIQVTITGTLQVEAPNAVEAKQIIEGYTSFDNEHGAVFVEELEEVAITDVYGCYACQQARNQWKSVVQISKLSGPFQLACADCGDEYQPDSEMTANEEFIDMLIANHSEVR